MGDPAVVVTHADVGAPDLILLRDVLYALEDTVFSQWLIHLKIAPKTDIFRNSRICEFIQGLWGDITNKVDVNFGEYDAC